MNIFLCGECGFLGIVSNLECKIPGKDNKFYEIIVANSLRQLCCPKCHSPNIYTKPFADNLPVASPSISIPSVWVDPKTKIESNVVISKPNTEEYIVNSKEDLIEAEIIKEVLDSLNEQDKEIQQPVNKTTKTTRGRKKGVPAELKVNKTELKPNAKPAKEKVAPNRTENTARRFTSKCDTCGKNFESKDNFGNNLGSRCDKCLEDMINKYARH